MKAGGLRLFMMPWVLLAGLVLTGCGDKVEIRDAAGNAILLLDASPDKLVEALGLTLKRIKVWKSAPNSESPGGIESIDQYKVEIWGRLEGEEGDRYFANMNAAYFADADGNLYPYGNEPGKITYLSSENRTKDPVLSYTVSAQDAFITQDFPIGAERTEATSTNNGTKNTTIIEFLEVDTMGDDAPWKGYRSYQATTMFSRNRMVKNIDYATKAKLGCLLKLTAPIGDLLARTFYWGEVELGDHIVHSSGARNDSDDDGNVTGDDDALMINWEESWFLTGLNINTRTLRVFRGRRAPFYANRELPGVDTDDTEPKPSGLEKLIRECNTNAADGGLFQFISLNNISGTTLDLGNPEVPFCTDFNANVIGNELALKSIPLTNVFDASCVTPFIPGQIIGGGGIKEGNWDGSAHSTSGPVAEASSILKHIEQTEITDITF